MAVNESRDMSAELRLGATDGSYKSFTPGRGGEMSLDTVLAREQLSTAVHYDYTAPSFEERRMPTGDWSKWNYGRR